ncbi:hypothetical protein OAN33_05720 [Flavobacteriales bacterium]|nr:hypothetical protein [Flavobacteriales bacterium]
MLNLFYILKLNTKFAAFLTVSLCISTTVCSQKQDTVITNEWIEHIEVVPFKTSTHLNLLDSTDKGLNYFDAGSVRISEIVNSKQYIDLYFDKDQTAEGRADYFRFVIIVKNEFAYQCQNEQGNFIIGFEEDRVLIFNNVSDDWNSANDLTIFWK